MKSRSSLAQAFFLAGIICVISVRAHSQSKSWIEFHDKGIVPSSFHPGDSVFDAVRSSLSLACLHRRSVALEEAMDSTIAIEDAPIFPAYLDSLRAIGISFLAESKWCNAVSACLTDSQANQLLQFPFVKGIIPVGIAKLVSTEAQSQSKPNLHPSPLILHPFESPHPLSFPNSCGYDPIIYEYGDTNIGSTNRSDLDRINVWPLHAMGLDGSGVKLGHLDVGCDLAVSSLDSENVLFQYDYVFHDSSVENPQDEHGTETLSTATGYLPDTLMGPAYKCSVMIAHTENTDYEENIEEDNYAEALEAFESRGVQITTSSLGYFTFDSGQHSYTYADMNGQTAICTQAVERAVKLGILVCTAMGNGNGGSYIHVQAPADADSILACGALDTNDTIAGFSSLGPTSDGRIKPDICAPGVDVWAQGPLGNFGQLNGTSFSTPLTSGSCCLILQAHPNATAQQIRHAVMMTGDRASHPDTVYGWGKLNAYAAALALGTVINPMQIWIDTALHICAGIASQYPIENATLTYFGDSDINSRTAQFSLAADSLVYSSTTAIGQTALTNLGAHVYYRITAVDGSGATTVYPLSGWEMFSVPSLAGVSENSPSVSSQIEAYPNPSSDHVSLNVAAGGNWRMYNATGSVMTSGSSEGPATIQIPTAALPSASYYIEFITDSGETKTISVAVIH